MSHSMLRKGRWRQLAFGPRPSAPRASDFLVLAVVATALLAGLCLLAAANAVEGLTG